MSNVNNDDYCSTCTERKIYCRCGFNSREAVTERNRRRDRITNEAKAREFVADMILTYAYSGPEAANNMMLALGRSELQNAFSALSVSYIREASKNLRNQESNDERS